MINNVSVTSSQRHIRTTTTATATGAWRGHVISGVALLLVLGACSSVSPDDDETGDGGSEPTAESEVPEQTDAPPVDDEPAPEPTQEDLWRSAYELNEAAYLAAVAGILGLDELEGDASGFAIGTCSQLRSEKPLERRVRRVVGELALSPELTFPKAVAIIATTVENVCPDSSRLHRAQVADRAEAKRVAARAARKERRIREEREAEQNAPVEVFYGNCSEVEAAGAAPIYAGDPGYSTDLDRDQDGVACEQ